MRWTEKVRMTVFELMRLRRLDLIARLLRMVPPHSSLEENVWKLTREQLVCAILYYAG